MGKKYDFYTGFEGEPEYIFFVESVPDHKLHIWAGYFDSLMRAIEKKDPTWESLFKYHQLDDGWFRTSPWVVPNVEIALAQLQLLRLSDLNEDTQKVYVSLCTLFQDALRVNANVIVVYE